MNVAANIAGTRHISLSCYQLFLVHLQPMEEGLGPGVVAAVGELSQEEGELGLQSLVVGGPAEISSFPDRRNLICRWKD